MKMLYMGIYSVFSFTLMVSCYEYDKHQNAIVTNVATVETHVLRAPLECGTVCSKHETCLAYQFSQPVCHLYDTDEVEIAESPGHVVTSLASTAELVWTILNLPEQNGGKGNIFHKKAVQKAGIMYKWKVQCAQVGIVWLNIWRPMGSGQYMVVGTTRIEVTDLTKMTLITHLLPLSQRYAVEVGDLLGFTYESLSTQARVSVVDTASSHPDITTADMALYLSTDKKDVTVGQVVGSWNLAGAERVPVLAAYFA